MPVPALPASGSTNWYPWASGIHEQVVAGLIVLVASGGTYPARPSASAVPGGHVLYIGTVTPTDAVEPDRWDNA